MPSCIHQAQRAERLAFHMMITWCSAGFSRLQQLMKTSKQFELQTDHRLVSSVEMCLHLLLFLACFWCAPPL